MCSAFVTTGDVSKTNRRLIINPSSASTRASHLHGYSQAPALTHTHTHTHRLGIRKVRQYIGYVPQSSPKETSMRKTNCGLIIDPSIASTYISLAWLQARTCTHTHTHTHTRAHRHTAWAFERSDNTGCVPHSSPMETSARLIVG